MKSQKILLLIILTSLFLLKGYIIKYIKSDTQQVQYEETMSDPDF